MGFLMPKPPAMPPPPAPPPVPTLDNARERQQGADAMNKRRGRATDILTSERGDLSTAPIGTKALLGG